MCQVCGGTLRGNQLKYCSRQCINRRKHRRTDADRARDRRINSRKMKARYRRRITGKSVPVLYAQCVLCRTLYVRHPSPAKNRLHCRRPVVGRRRATCHPERDAYVADKCQTCHRNRPPRPIIECPACGEPFMKLNPQHAMHAACSRAIRKRREKDRRRALEAGTFVEDVDRWRVYERDSWTCQICNQPVPRGYVVPHPLAPTIDHITPLASGGTHEYANVQLAHFECNSRKSDRIGWTWTEAEGNKAA